MFRQLTDVEVTGVAIAYQAVLDAAVGAELAVMVLRPRSAISRAELIERVRRQANYCKACVKEF